MEKADFKSRANNLREGSKKNKGNNYYNNSDEKKCPFRDQVCNASCKLFRANKPGFECPFQEINSMSYNLMTIVKRMGPR